MSGWPLVGSAFAFGRDPVGFLRSVRRAHGDVFTLRLGTRRVTFAVDPRDAATLMKAGDVLVFEP